MRKIRFKVRYSYYTKVNYAIKAFGIARREITPITIRWLKEGLMSEHLFFKSWEGDPGAVELQYGTWLGAHFVG